MTWTGMLPQVIQIAALALGAWLVRILKSPTALERAQHLALIASDVVNALVVTHPGATWGQLLQLAVQDLEGAAGLTVTNHAALERAALQALTEHGLTAPQAQASRKP